jgi:hypothetical protein
MYTILSSSLSTCITAGVRNIIRIIFRIEFFAAEALILRVLLGIIVVTLRTCP